MIDPAQAFWDFSGAFYREPGVQNACLALQDDYGLDVNLLLYACWLGLSEGVALTEAERGAALARAKDWKDTVLLPLRGARRAVKAAQLAGAGEDLSADLYEALKQAELKAERIAQNFMVKHAPQARPELTLAERRKLAEANLALCLGSVGAVRDAAHPIFAAIEVFVGGQT
jgi:uncharacterized protein (TIGR02444 family)